MNIISQLAANTRYKKDLSIIGLSGFIGYVAWGSSLSEVWALCSFFIPIIWYKCTSRISASIAWYLYSLMASNGLVNGMAIYFDIHITLSVLMWLAGSVPVSMMALVCWRQSEQQRLVMIPVLLILITIPPVGLFGWAHPILSAGWLFPDWGWLGLMATIVLMMVLARIRIPRKLRHVPVVVMGIG